MLRSYRAWYYRLNTLGGMFLCSSMLSILFYIALSAQVIAASVFSGPQQVASNEYDFIIVGGE